MGFYGNISNMARTQFQFDRIYTSRTEMDNAASEDGVYTGRYVLVNYEDNSSFDTYYQAYKATIEVNGEEQVIFYSSPNEEFLTRLKWVETEDEVEDNDTVFAGQIIAIPPDGHHNLVNPENTEWEFWYVQDTPEEIEIPVENHGENEPDTEIVYYAAFSEFEDIYSEKYVLDKQTYGTARGYDSTVWQKVYVNGVDKYVMIAELNTITPIFDLAPDAPKMVPLTPHFDASSTNTFYKLHWSPSWGFRVKAANPNLKGPILKEDGSDDGSLVTLLSSDPKEYLSDDTMTWEKTVYDGFNQSQDFVFTVDSTGTKGRWIEKNEEDRPAGYMGAKEEVIETPAAIYYNKAGFSPEHISYAFFEKELDENTYQHGVYYTRQDNRYVLVDNLNFDPELTYYEKLPDSIKLQPTGRSGHKYNKHDGSMRQSVQEDMQELSIMLPTIGNTIAAIWDLVYGGQELSGGLERNLDVKWEKARASMDRHGLRLVTDYDFDNHYNYQVDNVNTVAGVINSVHDLMGMIITSDTHDNLKANMELLDENRIYYDETNHTFNRKHKKYVYDTETVIPYTYDPVDITATEWASGEYFIPSGSDHVLDTSIAFDPNQQYFIRKLTRENEYTKVDANSGRETYHLFDGTVYAYKDFIGTDPDAIALVNADYVRDKKYHSDKEYYRWDSISTQHYPSLSGEYQQNKLYYYSGTNNRGGDYILSLSQHPTEGRVYFELIEDNLVTLADTVSLQPNQRIGFYAPGSYLYKQYFSSETNERIYDLTGLNPDTDYYYNFALAIEQNLSSSQSAEVTPIGHNEYYKLDGDNVSDAQQIINGNIYTKVVVFMPVALDDSTYTKDTYYTLKENMVADNNEDHYQLETSETVDENKHYYAKAESLVRVNNNQYVVNEEFNYYLINFSADTYYYKQGKDYKVLKTVADAMKLDPSEIYVLRNNAGDNGDWKLNLPGDWNEPSFSAFIRQTDFYEPGVYHYLTEEYEPIAIDDDDDYHPNTYYIKVNGQYVLDDSETKQNNIQYYQESNYTDYILDTYPTKTHGTRYYKLFSVGSKIDIGPNFKFWEAYKYYTVNGAGEYTLITDDSVIPEEFYIRDSYYVIHDDKNIIPYGMPWNSESEYVPASITLARREETWDLEPFGDFARNINTMHGMLLKTKAMLDYDNKDSRDIRTVQGAINLLNDKLAHFSTWTPGQLIIADDYNRIHGATLQQENTWIDVQVNRNVVAPTIKITHIDPISNNATPVGPTNTQSPAFGGIVNIPAFAIDAKGHVATTGVQMITVPSLSLASGDSVSITANLANVITGLTYAAGTNSGTFTKTESAVKDLLLTGYSASTIAQADLTAISSSDSIGIAFNKIQNAVNNINNAIEAMDLTEITAGTGEVISAVSQTNGQISVSKKSLEATDIPDIQANEFEYTPTGKTNAETFSLQTIIDRLVALEDAQ